MLTLSDLPTELVYRIAECLAPVPAEAPEEKVFSNRAMRARRPLENLASLIALSETCWIVRAAVGPLLFRRVKLTNRKHMKDIAESAWDLDVQCLEIQLSKFDSDDSTCWFDALHLFHLLDALRNLQHMSIEIDRTSGQEMTLAILATLLEPPPVLELSPSATRVSCLANIESFSLSCIQSPLARLHPKFLDSILPLLDQLRGLKTFELMIQEPPETHWFPRLEDVLPHLPRGLEQLRLEAVFKESAPQQVGLINDCFAQLEWLLMLPLVLRSGLVDFRDTDDSSLANVKKIKSLLTRVKPTSVCHVVGPTQTEVSLESPIRVQ